MVTLPKSAEAQKAEKKITSGTVPNGTPAFGIVRCAGARQVDRIAAELVERSARGYRSDEPDALALIPLKA